MNKKLCITALIIASIAAMGGVALASEKKDGAPEKKMMALEVGYFKPSLEFNAHYVLNGIGARDVSFKKDLGVRNKNAPEYRLWLNDCLRLSYTEWDFKGSKTLGYDITWGGVVYQAGSSAAADLDVYYSRLTWLRPITRSQAIATDWLIDIKVFSFDASITGRDAGTGNTVTKRKQFRGVVPTIGFRLETNPGASRGVSFFSEISGLPLGKYGYFYDAEAGLKYQANKQFSVKAAYRVFDLNVKEKSSDGSKAQFKQSGPYFEIAYKF
ncbi:hypothetical protein [Anaeroselena agilis]|uniref:Uncharacterized protein n=1 Tax=Anaeroselena agilis TaxID=3063788 RepID=A0ABU3P221_9FIRM|nr:hypothetical protein [Selenomonadales bacterium 4137-cl]